MNCDLTIAIATFNGAERFPLVLDALRSQITPASLNWEILIIDNNSSDDTAAQVKRYQAEWRTTVPLRYCFEPQQGLAFARQRAIETASGTWVGFLDDDNLPSSTWVAEAYAFGQAHPQVGGYGSQIQGRFEIEPPENLQKILFYLAIVNRGSQPSQYSPRQNGVPPGAGVVVRKDAWLAHVPPRLLLAGRVGGSMLSCEDLEALLHLHNGGWEIWHNPAMQIEHLIPANRLNQPYFMGLMRGVGLCRHHLRMLMLKTWQRPLAFGLYLVSDAGKVLRHLLHKRMAIAHEPVAACEMQLLLGILVSPFYLWSLRLSRLIK